MARKSGGEILVDCLLAHGVDTMFGVPGESYLPLLDALYGVSDRLRTVMCRQEGGAGFMAEAYGKLTGRPGLCVVTRGPGATNASIAVHTARQNSTPMILLIGQVERAARHREAFQEVDYAKFFGDMAKWVVEIDDPARIPELVGRAFQTAVSGRPGPVVIALPEDMLSQTLPAEAVEVRMPGPYQAPAPSDATMGSFFDHLSRAERPLLLVGGGGWSQAGRRDLKAFAEQNDLPVLAGFRWQDLFDNHSDCYVGDLGVGLFPVTRDLVEAADAIFAVGLDLGEILTQGYSLLSVPYPQQTLVHVHASDGELGKVYQPNLAIHAGPDTFFAAALARDKVPTPAWRNWRAQARADFLAQLTPPPQPGAVDMGDVMAWLRDHLPDDVIITNGAGNFTIWPNKFYLFGEQARLLAAQSGPMGYGVPASVAAKIVEPDRTVVCFAGDGDFQMNGQELMTAAQEGAQPVVIVLNNGIFGTIRMHQERHYPGRVMGTDLLSPDFQKLAQAYGYHGERVARTQDFPAAFERAVASKSGAIIELMIDAEGITPRQRLSQIRAEAVAKGQARAASKAD
ncbi:MAG: thiamine pyrophosphate-binding protein [Pseudomonadota bacterium]